MRCGWKRMFRIRRFVLLQVLRNDFEVFYCKSVDSRNDV